MNNILNTTGFIASVVILSTVIFYYAYYFAVNSGLPEKYCNKFENRIYRETSQFLVKKVSGLFMLGIIPGLIYYYSVNSDFEHFGLSLHDFTQNIFIITTLITAISIVVFINQKVNRQNNSLQIDLYQWNPLLFIINAAGWIIFIVGYEFLFRGILLFECHNSFGFWPAVAINTSLYSAVHMVNGKNQTFGALIFGVVACYFTLICRTVLIPIFMHVALSLLSDYFSIKYNNTLLFIKQKGFNLPKI